jgi:uncharacterized protein with HEPN domain
MNPKTQRQLKNILVFSKRIQERTQDISLSAFLEDDFLQDAVLYCLGQVGETATNIQAEEQEKYPELFWRQMIGLRNRLFHDYEEIDLTRVYDITQGPISQLIDLLEIILSDTTE